MADAPSAERRSVTAAILGMVTRQGFSSNLKVIGVDGSKPIVVAFADETIGDVFERVSWSAGFANLIVVMGEGDIAMASVLPPASSLHERDAEPLELANPDGTIGMLIEASREAGHAGFNIRIASSTVKIDAVEDAKGLVAAS